MKGFVEIAITTINNNTEVFSFEDEDFEEFIQAIEGRIINGKPIICEYRGNDGKIEKIFFNKDNIVSVSVKNFKQ